MYTPDRGQKGNIVRVRLPSAPNISIQLTLCFKELEIWPADGAAGQHMLV